MEDPNCGKKKEKQCNGIGSTNVFKFDIKYHLFVYCNRCQNMLNILLNV